MFESPDSPTTIKEKKKVRGLDRSGCSLFFNQARLKALINKKIDLKLIVFQNPSDVNECSVANGGCDHVCENLPGTFKCTCKPGFVKDQVNGKCEGSLTPLHYVQPWDLKEVRSCYFQSPYRPN